MHSGIESTSSSPRSSGEITRTSSTPAGTSRAHPTPRTAPGRSPHATVASMETFTTSTRARRLDTRIAELDRGIALLDRSIAAGDVHEQELGDVGDLLQVLQKRIDALPKLGQVVHYDVEDSMSEICTPKHYAENRVRNEQDPTIVHRQLEKSARDVLPGCTPGWSMAGSDHMMIDPRPGNPDERFGPLEGNSRGSAGTSYYGEEVQEILQHGDQHVGQVVYEKHGANSLTLVFASGSAEKPSRWSHEKFKTAVTGITSYVRNTLGSSMVKTMPYVPGKFEARIKEDPSLWANSKKTTVVGIPMSDSLNIRIGPEGYEAKNPNEHGEYELFFMGKKVNAVVGDGGLSQVERLLAIEMGVKQVSIDPQRCHLANPTSVLGNDKFTFLSCMNDFQRLTPGKYGFYAQKVHAFLATNPTELEEAARKMFNTPTGGPAGQMKTPILKADNGRHGKGNLICKGGEDNLGTILGEFAEMLASINPPGKQISGSRVCVTETFSPRTAHYEPGSKRAELDGAGTEARVITEVDYRSQQRNRSGGEGQFVSNWAETKLTAPGMRTANQSVDTGEFDATDLTQAMNKDGYKAVGETEKTGDQLAAMMSEFWQFATLNRGFYQMRDARTDALDMPAETLKLTPMMQRLAAAH